MQKALAVLAQQGPLGATWEYVDADQCMPSAKALRALAEEGRCFPYRKRKKTTKAIRYFLTEAMRDTYIQAEEDRLKHFNNKHRGRPLGGIGFKEGAVVVWPKHVKVIKCPGPQLRGVTNTFDGEIL